MNLSESATVSELNDHSANSAAANCGIRVDTIGDNWVEASMPIDRRTRGLDGALRLGALAILAESVGSLAAAISVDRSKFICLGQTLQVIHLASATKGPVQAKATPIEIGADRHIWNIDIVDAEKRPIANAKLTTVILDAGNLPAGQGNV